MIKGIPILLLVWIGVVIGASALFSRWILMKILENVPAMFVPAEIFIGIVGLAMFIYAGHIRRNQHAKYSGLGLLLGVAWVVLVEMLPQLF